MDLILIMIIIPAVDIKSGRCVRLREGRADAETIFSDHPLEMAQKWVDQGAERLHIIDLDGAFEKGPRNRSAIKEIVEAIKIPIQLGGGIRDLKTVESYLSLGLTQVILGTAALKDPALVKEACRFFPGQIMVSLDARDNRLAVEGWTEISEKDPVDLAKQYEDWGVKAIIFTDISRDGTQQGPVHSLHPSFSPSHPPSGDRRRRDRHPGRCPKSGRSGGRRAGRDDYRTGYLQRIADSSGSHKVA